jgi:hypothetical protein
VSDPVTHLLVLGDKRGTAWVLRESRMALARERVREASQISAGSPLLLYASGSAFGGANSGLFGLALAERKVEYLDSPFRLNFKEFHAHLPLKFQELTHFGDFVDMRPLVEELDLFAGNRDKWGVYLRRPLIPISSNDSDVLRNALAPKRHPAGDVLGEYLAATE